MLNFVNEIQKKHLHKIIKINWSNFTYISTFIIYIIWLISIPICKTECCAVTPRPVIYTVRVMKSNPRIIKKIKGIISCVKEQNERNQYFSCILKKLFRNYSTVIITYKSFSFYPFISIWNYCFILIG